ncbi:MAG: hypothetical protein NT062_06675 [Proteobacteria bacterium]|nr:hypothetical protein [Pseudomonadota bacterium]
MTINPRAIRALRAVRTRLRDVAAAEHSVAANARDGVAARLRSEHDLLGEVLEDAHRALAAARTVYELDLVADGIVAQRGAIANAATAHADASAVVDLTAARLRERTRQLRTAEKLVELSDDERYVREARAEQRGTDDLASRRR